MANSGIKARSLLELLDGIAAVVESLPGPAVSDPGRVLHAGHRLREIREALSAARFEPSKALSALDLVSQILQEAEASGLDAWQQEEVAAALRASLLFRSQVAKAVAERQSGEPDLPLQEIERHPVPAATFASVPTFIIGYRRSGTTLLSWLLNSHANIASVPESFVCFSLLASPEASSPWSEPPRPWVVLSQQSTERLGEPRSRYFQRVAELIDGVFSDYAARQGKRRWVSKEVFLHQRLDLLDLIFGYSARFIYLFRHGVDAACSAAQRFGTELGAPLGKGGPDIRAYLEEWVHNNEATLDFVERNEGRCHRVRYEDLVHQPQAVARDLLRFLGEPWQPTILKDMQRQDHHPGLGDSRIFATGGKILADRMGRWKGWPPPLLRQLGRLADPMLERLGYPPLVGESGHRPLASLSSRASRRSRSR